MDVPAGVTQEEGHTGILHLLSAVLAFILLAERIQPFLFLADREIGFCVRTIYRHLLSILFIYSFISVRKNPSSCDDTEVRTRVPTSEGFEVTN